MRWNNAGVHVEHKSSPSFECDNSVYGNTVKDFILRDTSTVVGDSNYTSVQSLALDIDQYSVFTWTNPVGSDPLLRKSGSHTTALAQRRASDERYSRAFDAAMGHKLLGRYTMAVEKFADALAFVGSRWEAEQCLVSWEQTFMDATLNAPSDGPMSHGSVAGQVRYIDDLSMLRSDERFWLRNTATEFLADHWAQRSRYDLAVPLYGELASMIEAEPLLSRRAHLNLVILMHRGLRDWESAYRVEQAIERNFPRTHEVIWAKIDLGLPLTNEDSLLIRNVSQPGAEKSPEMLVLPSGLALSDAYPNPFRATTTITYAIPIAMDIELTVYDAAGRKAETLVTQRQESGRYSVSFNTQTLRSGVYTYRLIAHDEVEGARASIEKRMIVVR